MLLGLLLPIACQSGISDEQKQEYLDLATYYDERATTAGKTATDYYQQAQRYRFMDAPRMKMIYEQLMEKYKIYYDIAAECRELALEYRQLASQ